jgi:N-acetylglucosamine-6-phosphate deacetylase
MIVKSNRIYFEDGRKSGYIVIEDGKFCEYRERIDTENYIDYGNNRIIPGIFDTHNHGACGYPLMGIDTEEVRRKYVRGFLKGLVSQGVTNIFPTVGPEMIGTIAALADKKTEGATILGIHSEGPWLNRTGEKGIRTPWPEVDITVAKKMVSDGMGLLKLVALAPEIPGIEELIKYFLSEGVTVAFAHSDCNYEQALQAFRKGITVVTHTGNVMTGMHHRDIGGLGAALLSDAVECEVICDGMHISLDMLKIYFRVKDPSSFMMISDGTHFSGAPAGKYKGWDPSMTLNVTEEGFVLSDTGRLCGSSQPVLYGMGNLVEKLQLPMETVIQMAALNPCRKYGFEKKKGSIRIGKEADFVVISDDYKALATYVNGKKAYDREDNDNIFNQEFYSIMKL